MIATSFFNPEKIPDMIVIPDLETPLKKASGCEIPTIKAFKNVISFIDFIFDFCEILSMNKNKIPIEINPTAIPILLFVNSSIWSFINIPIITAGMVAINNLGITNKLNFALIFNL